MFNSDSLQQQVSPDQFKADCIELNLKDEQYLQHEIVQRFGSPLQPIYVNPNTIEINGTEYNNPLILPIYNGHLEHIQCAVLNDDKRVEFTEGSIAKGFTYYGELHKDKPILITYDLEAFFKVAQTGYAVVLVLLPTLCNKKKIELKPFDFEQIQFVIQQLKMSGFVRLYIPVRPEHIHLESFQSLEQNTSVRLLSQYLKIDENEFLIELSKDESIEEVTAFIDEAIELLPKKELFPKGHFAKPFRYGDGVFHLLEDGLYYIEQTKDDEYKRYISSPIRVLAQTRDTTNNAWGRLLEWQDADGVKHTQALSMELFQSDGVELRKALAYQGVIIAPDGRARNLLQSYLMSYPTDTRALCVDRVGWHDDVFVLPNEQIGQHENDDLIVYQTTQGIDSNYQSKGTLQQWQKKVSIPLSTHSKLVVALSSAFAGQLLAPLEQQTGAGVHFKGQSSKGKTTALYVGCSVWGKPSSYCKTWKSTGNALEHTAYIHNDGFLALDEIGEVANPKELGNIAYMLANGKGKARLTKEIKAKPSYAWKIIFLSTGEKSLKEIMQENGQKTKLGQEVRLIDIDIDQSKYGLFDQIDFAEDGAKQSRLLVEHSNQTYGVAGMEWLKYLTHDKEKVISQAKQLLEQYNLELIAEHKEGHVIRVANAFALIAVAGELATQAGITGWKTGTTFNAVKTVFNDWVNNFEYVGDYQIKEYILHVKAFFEANESSRFEAITPDPDHIEKIINRVGYWKIDNGEKLFLVLPEQFKNEVCKGHDSRKVAKALLIEKLLEHDTSKNTKTVRLPSRSKSIRVYAVKDAIFSWES
jgi:putative DNA primase/helicase